MNSRLKWGIAMGALVAAGSIYYYFNPGYCRSAKSKYGLELSTCPEGKMLQLAHVQASGLSRTKGGRVEVSARAVFTVGKADEEHTQPLDSFSVQLALVAADGTETALQPEAEKEADRAKGKKGKWSANGNTRSARISLPDVDDGDYKLRATVKSKVGESVVDVPLALYAPAKIHVLTDRPLYEPGNVVQFRALALRANDLTPIDRRPGKWLVRDPSGELLLEEKVSATGWGVVSGSFPIDPGAASGQWTVSWVSGADVDQRTFTVQPFTLPRFRVEAGTEQPFYGRRTRPVLSGAVSYSSGAPVVGARINVTWNSTGSWPPPPEWIASELPKTIEVEPNGRFRVTLPEVPDDLREQTTLVATLAATDPAGDRVVGQARVLLSADPIKVEALTELAGGLVQGSNNRMYLRVTTADGRPLPGAKINVKRGWEPTDKGIDTELDADAVGRVQVDPGPPVNVVVPPMPVRTTIASRGVAVVRTKAADLVSQEDASLADRRAMDGWTASVAECGKWAFGSVNTSVGIRVAPSGQVVSAVGGEEDISKCVAAKLARARLPGGKPRLYNVSYQFQDPKLPTLEVASSATLDAVDGVEELLTAAATDARTCVGPRSPEDFGDGIAWQIRSGAKKITTSWIRVSSESSMSSSLKNCIIAAIARRELDEPAEAADLGVARFSVSFPAEIKVAKPQPTIMKGYELRVTAELADGEKGATIVRLQPGAIPRIRLRATPVVAKPGEVVEVAVLRGPKYDRKLPKKIRVRHLDDVKMVELSEKRIARFELPADAKGWYLFDGVDNASARVYVKSKAELEVEIAAAEKRYRPGDKAQLNITTKEGGQGIEAAVGLFGVDASLGQLVALPGPDELSGLRPPIEMKGGRAFGVLDAQALTVGRIRGANAAEATVLRVSRVPSPADLDVAVNGYAETSFDPVAIMTDRFYPILAELHAQTREWERSAPKGEEMSNKVLAGLWKKSLEAVKARGGAVEDAYGRDLRLHRLPGDLLALTEPQQVVVVGTRLPEDFDNWANWVRKERP